MPTLRRLMPADGKGGLIATPVRGQVPIACPRTTPVSLVSPRPNPPMKSEVGTADNNSPSQCAPGRPGCPRPPLPAVDGGREPRRGNSTSAALQYLGRLERAQPSEDRPKRVTHMDIKLYWPGLSSGRVAAAERAADLCPIHTTLKRATEISRQIIAAKPV